MARETKATTARIDENVLERWRKFLDENDASHGRTLEKAMTEYMDHDRTARIEDRLDRLPGEIVDALSESTLERERRSSSNASSPSAGTSSPATASTRTEKTVAAMVADIPADSTMTASMVDTLIEEHAGASYKTIKKYKRLLGKRGKLLAHPIEPETFLTSPERLVRICENNRDVPPSAIANVIEEHADTLGAHLDHPKEWYLEAIEKAMPGLLANSVSGNATVRAPLPTDAVEEFVEDRGLVDDDRRGFQ